MEYRSVMPEIVGLWFQFNFDDIADQPPHLLRGQAQSLFRDFNCGLGDIEHSDAFAAAN
jgi:hypothetical protein